MASVSLSEPTPAPAILLLLLFVVVLLRRAVPSSRREVCLSCAGYSESSSGVMCDCGAVQQG